MQNIHAAKLCNKEDGIPGAKNRSLGQTPRSAEEQKLFVNNRISHWITAKVKSDPAREKVRTGSDFRSIRFSNLFQLSAVEKRPDYIRADLQFIPGPLRIWKVCVQSLRWGSKVSLWVSSYGNGKTQTRLAQHVATSAALARVLFLRVPHPAVTAGPSGSFGATRHLPAVAHVCESVCEVASVWPSICGPLESVTALRGTSKPDGDLQEGKQQQTSAPIRAAVIYVATATGSKESGVMRCVESPISISMWDLEQRQQNNIKKGHYAKSKGV